MKHTFVHILCKKVTVLMLGVGLGTTLSAQLPYQNPDLTPEQRATDLLQRLTVEEKISLMQNNSPGIPRLGIRPYEWWNEALHGVARAGLATVFLKRSVWPPPSTILLFRKYLPPYLTKPEQKTVHQ